MAAGKDLEIGDGQAKKKKLIIIIGAAVLLAVVAVVAVLMMSGDPAEPVAAEAGAAETAVATDPNAAADKGSALYVSMPRPFIFNVPGASKDRLVQIKVQLLVRGSNNETLAMRHIPLIEGSLLETFSSGNADELVTVAGRDALKNKALSELQQAMVEVVGSVVVDEVLFTGFVMQ